MTRRDPLAAFEELVHKEPTTSVTYPGSKKVRRAVAGAPTVSGPFGGVKPITLTHRGQQVDFYPAGVLASALDRLPQTIRKWESKGYIPESDFRTPGRTVNGQKRLYTREQIEGMVKIAEEEGIVGSSNRNVSATAFPARVAALFKELSK